MALGLGLVTEDRKTTGLVLDMACGHNVTLPCLPRLSRFGVLDLQLEDTVVADQFERLRVRATSVETPALLLSGGNQQKLVLGKWLARDCRILLLDEPTRGIDVGAKTEIYKLIDDLVTAGYAIVLISSELPELLNLSSRVVVMRRGRVTGVLDRAEATQERVMQLMAGTNSNSSEVAPRQNVPDPKECLPIQRL
jgi:ABC-type sugar transport system ATPase subunit